MYHVLFLRETDAETKSYLQSNDCIPVIAKGSCEQEWIEEIAACKANGIFVRSGDLVTHAMIDASPDLKVIGKFGVGLDNIDLDYCTQKGIQVVFSPLGNAISVAEHATLLMLACAKKFTYVDQQFRNGNFEVRYTLNGTSELYGQTLGLLGCGRIGRILAGIAANGFQMNVVGYDPFVKQEQLDVPIKLLSSREELFQQSDFISLHLPSLPSTRGSIGLKEFQQMKNSAVFINCSRGDIIVEADLITALNSGEIRGAGLDVFASEPYDYSSPLLSMPQIVATPHMAGSTDQATRRCGLTTAKGIVEVLTGQPISFPANRLGS